MPLRRLPIYRSLSRPQLLLGAERELVLVLGMLAAILVFAAQTLVAVLAGSALWLAGVCLLRRMAKADPFMSRVYLRHIRYRAYYPARSRAAGPE
jgi:type IV secretion system protein VirB3